MKKLFILLLLISISLAVKINVITFYPPESFETPGGYTVTIHEPWTKIIAPGTAELFIDISVENPKGIKQTIREMKEDDFPYFFTNHIRVHLLDYCLECANDGPKVEVDVFDYTVPAEATGYRYASEINIEKGWNLLSSNFQHVDWDYSTCEKDDFKGMFFFDNYEKKYISASSPESNRFDWDYIQESAVWAYSKNKCKLLFYDLETKDIISLRTGWNFVGLTDGIKSKILGKRISDCEFEKVHYFLSESNSWSNHINLNYFSLPIPLGKGFIAKVKNNCYIDITKA